MGILYYFGVRKLWLFGFFSSSFPFFFCTGAVPSQKKENLIKQLGTGLINEVIDEICAVRSTILFTNTRSQSENWLFLLAASGKFKKHELAIHHSAIDAKIRKKAESDIKSGAVRCIIATASLDLGVDLEPVDKVLHLGSPKGFARLKQRAGRSGHSPFSTSKIILIPRNSFEISRKCISSFVRSPIYFLLNYCVALKNKSFFPLFWLCSGLCSRDFLEPSLIF